MMQYTHKKIFIALGAVLWFLGVMPADLPAQQAANVKLEVGKLRVPVNQPFTITITSDADLPSGIIFPEIVGMAKQGTSSSTSTTITSQGVSTQNSLTQRYAARKAGNYTLKPFVMRISGRELRFNGAVITMLPPQTDPGGGPPNYDPFEDFFSNRSKPVDARSAAFVSLVTDKKEVFVGEGFNLKLALYVSEENRPEMEFYELAQQVNRIQREIKPASCWEESFNITEVSGVPVRINGKPYSEYVIWQSSLFPLQTGDLTFPKQKLTMQVYEGVRDPFFRGLQRQAALQDFPTQPFTIKVKPLPPSTLGPVTAVGEYKLEERLGKNRLPTGQSTAYEFIIKGRGNLSAIEALVPTSDSVLDVYPPTITQQVNRADGQVTGKKTYAYLLQPKREGKIPLRSKGFRFYFFNPARGRYDSLVSRVSLTAEGRARIARTSLTGRESDESLSLSNSVIYLNRGEGMKVIGNIIILLLAVAAGWVVVRK